MDLSDRVKLLISKMDITQKKFAETIAISPARLNNYLSKVSNISPDIMVLISQTHHVNLNWLLTGAGDMFLEPQFTAAAAADFTRIEIVSDIAAGFPLPAFEYGNKRYLDIPTGLLSRPGQYYAFQVAGASMEPLLMNGDIAIISTNWAGLKLNSRIFAFRNTDGITLKKLVLNARSKSGFLFPVNPLYDPIPYDKSNTDITMIGVLILSLRYYNL